MGNCVGVRCPRGNVKHDECRACALRPDRPCHYTPDILERMRTQHRDLPPRTYTATMLLGCDRQAVLMAGDKDYYADVDDEWPKIRGHMVHALMESNPTTPGILADVREERFMAPIETAFGTFNFAGKPDLIRVKRVEGGVAYIDIVDYKSTGEIKHEKVAAAEEHQMQVNMYWWLISQTLLDHLHEKAWLYPPESAEALMSAKSVQIETIEIFYADMKKTRRFVNDIHLEAKGKRVGFNPLRYEALDLAPMSLLPLEVTEAWIVERIEDQEEGKMILPPVLAEDKSWMCYRCGVKEECAAIQQKEGR